MLKQQSYSLTTKIFGFTNVIRAGDGTLPQILEITRVDTADIVITLCQAY